MKIAAIVEGHGEVDAVPILFERILADRVSSGAVEILRKPHRVPKGKMVNGEELGRAVRLQGHRVGPTGVVVVLLDADEDCVRRLVETVRTRSQGSGNVKLATVIAVREFEAWLIAGLVPDDEREKLKPESLADPKGWLQKRLGRYSPTVDQPSLAAKIDLEGARSLRSFEKLVRELDRLTAA